jgi:4-amino-4-deoxy-L-arabinose transferase-like glycosyltransferase
VLPGTASTSIRPLAAAALAVTLAVGVALRVYVYRSKLGTPDSDEAVVGLMARRILDGDFTAFYWGQGYGGSQEALLTAPIFAVFGSSYLALRIVPILLSAVACVVVWRVGLRLFDRTSAVAAAAVLWVWPPFLIYKLTHQWGFYASGVLYAALLLLLTLRAAERTTRARVAVLGFVIGCALWEDVQLLPVVLPLVAWLIWRRPAVLRHAWLALPLAAVGGLPWIVWNLHHGFGSFQTHITTQTSYGYRVRVFFSPLLPMLLGLRETFTQVPLVSGIVANGIYALLVLAFAYGLYRSRRSDALVLYVVVCVFPFVYALSRQTLLSSEPRYLLVLSPVLALLLAQAAGTRARAPVLVAAAVALSAAGLVSMDRWMRTTGPTQPIAPRDLGPVIRLLDRARIRDVYAQYWAAYRLDFDTNERIVTAESQLTDVRFVHGRPYPSHNPVIRWRPYEREVDAADRVGFVFINWPADRKRAARVHVMRTLAAHGYAKHVYKDIIVYLPPG